MTNCYVDLGDWGLVTYSYPFWHPQHLALHLLYAVKVRLLVILHMVAHRNSLQWSYNTSSAIITGIDRTKLYPEIGFSLRTLRFFAE